MLSRYASIKRDDLFEGQISLCGFTLEHNELVADVCSLSSKWESPYWQELQHLNGGLQRGT